LENRETKALFKAFLWMLILCIVGMFHFMIFLTLDIARYILQQSLELTPFSMFFWCLVFRGRGWFRCLSTPIQEEVYLAGGL
jgi:hypothetical protein